MHADAVIDRVLQDAAPGGNGMLYYLQLPAK
jgi:hypothetical protein